METTLRNGSGLDETTPLAPPSAPMLRTLIFLVLTGFSLASPTILALGDSLTEGLGVKEDEAWPSLIENHLKEQFPEIRIINAGVSGATTAGGAGRLKWSLKGKPDIILIALGANNGLRGLSLSEMKKDLSEMLRLSINQAGKNRVLLIGMELPSNYGEEYRQEFSRTYRTLAEEFEVPFFPFLLKGVALNPELNLKDGIHPNAKGHRVIAGHLKPVIEELLKELP